MISVNATQGVSALVTMPKRGVWTADVDIDLALVPVAPSGPVVVTIGTNILQGTVDDRATGRFAQKGKVRVVGGGNGWDRPAPAVHIHNDAGITSSLVYATAAASAGEKVIDATPPKRLGVDYARMRGPASQVFAGVEWWVDILGITHVGPRPPLPGPLATDILSWDATARVAVIASDSLVLPGMVLIDPLRFGTAIVNDVEQTFGPEGARAIAWCSTPSVAGAALAALAGPPATAGSQLVTALGALAVHAVGAAKMRRYPYRVVTQSVDGRLVLANPKPTTSDAPPFLTLIDVWAGVAGYSCKVVPGTGVIVEFVDEQPVIRGFDPDAPPPLENELDAVIIKLGKLAVDPVSKATATQLQMGNVTAALVAVATYVAALTTLANTAPAFAAFAAGMAAPGGALSTALAGLAAANAALVAPATSIKVLAE